MTSDLGTARALPWSTPARRPSGLARTACALVLTVTVSAGCGAGGALATAHNLVDNAGLLSSMAAKVTRAQRATFEATYAITGNGSVTVVQKPPSSAFVTKTKRIITTTRYTFLCDTGNGRPLCQRSSADAGTTDPTSSLGVTGFVSGELALGVLTAAMVVPKAHVVKSAATIAGQPTSCVTVSGLDAAVGESAAPGQTGGIPSNFTVCITDGGVLAKFSGALTDGRKGDVLLTRYSTAVNVGLLKPPKGAKITS